MRTVPGTFGRKHGKHPLLVRGVWLGRETVQRLSLPSWSWPQACGRVPWFSASPQTEECQ